MFPSQVKLPEIQSGSASAVVANVENKEDAVAKWLNDQPEGRLVIQEKIDGTNFTVWRNPETLELFFFNKGKNLDKRLQENSTYVRTFSLLRKRPELFKPGFIYHGESMRATR